MRTLQVLSNRAVHNAAVPRVTVFIPTYNRAALLPHSIRGVLAQTFDDLRLVVSDNASEDETPEVVASFDDPRLEYVRQPENLGLLGNHNWFLTRVETDFALIVSDDDLVYPTLLERTVAELDRRPRAGVVHAAFDVIDEEGGVLLTHVDWTYGLEHDSVESAEKFIRESMRWSCRICPTTALVRTAALPPERMVEEDLPAIDFGLWLRIAAAGWEFAFLNDTLGAFRIHGQAHSAGFGTPQGPGYLHGIEIASHLKALKLRFLAQNDGRLSDVERLRRLAEEARRRELVIMARNLTLPERKPGPTLRALAQAVRADPAVLLGAPPWKLAAGSLVGPRVVEWLKGRSG
jgi:glycosyltransferase involved in cell wall biosynthesis